jgi:hypothetical protein
MDTSELGCFLLIKTIRRQTCQKGAPARVCASCPPNPPCSQRPCQPATLPWRPAHRGGAGGRRGRCVAGGPGCASGCGEG